MLEKSRRVVIRGVGLVSCLGVTVSENWMHLLRNDCGIGLLDGNCAGGPCRIGGRVNNGAMESRWRLLEEEQAFLPGVERQIDRRAMSRASVLGMLASQEALKQSGWLPQHSGSPPRNYSVLNDVSYRAGTYFSTGLEGVAEILSSQARVDRHGYAGMGAHVLPRTLANMPVAHISRAWGLRGPNMACSTSCASGLHSIGEAFRMIQHGEADMVLAGAAEAPLNPWSLMAFSRIRALSMETQAQRASRPFDAARDGFVMAEGAAALVLESWPSPTSSSAQPPIAEVLGFGRSADAYSLVSPEPSGDGAFRSMKAALDDAGIDSLDELGHINCHATSTPVGDVIELSAVARLIATYGKRSHSEPIHVNSVKGHLGHCLGAAGAVEAAYSAMAAHHGVCVGNRNLERPISSAEVVEILKHGSNEKTARSVAQRLFENISFDSDRDWAERTENNGRRRLVLTNSFGFGGTNASLLLSNYVK
ncbi:3-oxoacyl-[acyl-carrier-protein] synthase, mitochondrial [Echinococcus granulosus]|uniref:beta-ketoacyl-[acyl-carrier-protein] synthase I n=1 Tax=Echinococcus granulosus TaxID=6210 RepID=U6J2R3_ECHGR|nr:3-oxoacyl-[acyl-carrier-protein] synthase [Echinococcus granulosus]EUB63820.1 3-oxoacyl-[acyl-carrier-protein] synthase [Echinococcus granulosus]KAH9285484.1 3-oxoacyl-[acyl-carrier-protein] synthase, mitochondrial [Echinococcus granulosus]CDS15985.1 3 oxoacyl acyl carrier protein synthase [Echinococcus granulosus]